jgi:molybdopterin-biosynthesis enzyme MoeA-like protein
LNTAAGQVRAYAYAHNAPLPEAGSFNELVLSEVILRERNAKFAEVALMTRLLGAVAGASEASINQYLETYKEELYQLRYNSKYRTATDRRKTQVRAAAAREARLMSRIERMTEDDVKDTSTRNG